MMANLQKVKDLTADAQQLKDCYTIYDEKTKPKRCDKHGIGFGTDSRFSAFKSNVSFDSWAGYYGDSNCGRIISFVDSAEVSRSFDAYIKLKEREIIAWMADDMQHKALALKENAIAELRESMTFIETIGVEVTDE